MKSTLGQRAIHFIAPLAIASAIGCGGASPEAEGLGETSQAVSTGGMTASVTIGSHTATTWTGTVTVSNGGATLASNWQVSFNMGQSAFSQTPSNTEILSVNGQSVLVPTSSNATLNPGASLTFSISGSMPSGSTNWTPTIAAVDGDAPGTVGNVSLGWPSDGVDHVARAVATGALGVAMAYENNKLPNKSDANYGLYDNFLWSAQAYTVSGGKIAFDPNVPGYAYIPQQAMAALSAMQDAPEVASYLTAGLASCFKDTKAGWVYSFRAGVLKGSQNGLTTTGSITGQLPPATDYKPSGYNYAKVVDTFSTKGIQNGGSQVNVSLSSTTATPDFWFGLLTYTDLVPFSNTAPITAKFNAGGQTAACSPFNGPGGSANPYFTIALNGSNVAARFTGVGAQCYSVCTSTMVLDPVPYAEPGAYYDTSGNLVGMQSNPFQLDPTVLYSTPDHASQWATRVVSSVQQWGTFSSAVTLFGVSEYKYVKQM